MRLTVLALGLVIGVVGSGPPGAAEAASCGTHGCILDMSPTIYVSNNQWGNDGVGSGSITVSSPTAWSTSWDFSPSTDWTVISYPSAVLGWQWGYRLPNTGFPVALSARTPINTTVAFDYRPDPSCSTSRVCRLNVAYDLWLHTSANAGTSTPAYEVMVWLAYSRELFSGTPARAHATLAGHRWKVIQTQGGSSPVATFLLDEPADLTGATLNLTDFTDWLVTNQWIPASWWVDSVQFGTEIFKGKGTLDVTHYSASVGGAPAPSPAPSPSPAPPPPPPPATGPIAINAGGQAAAPFVADVGFTGGTAATNWNGVIDLSGAGEPAPEAVYRSERYGPMRYTISGLTAGENYDVRLHFAENYFTSAGQRVFDVAINGTPVLTGFDVFAAAGAAHRANVQQFVVAANASGQLVVTFTNVMNNALVNGIEVRGSSAGAAFAVGATSATPGSVTPGQTVTIATRVTAGGAPAAGINIDLGVWNTAGTRVAQQIIGGQSFAAGQTRSYSWPWTVPAGLAAGSYRVSVAVFDSTWRTMYTVKTHAATVSMQGPVVPAALAFTGGPTAAAPSSVPRGQSVTINTTVRASAPASAIIVDLEIYDSADRRIAQRVFSGQTFAAGQTRSYSWTWPVPGNQATGRYTVKLGVFDGSWRTLYLWNNAAATFAVTNTTTSGTRAVTGFTIGATSATPGTVTPGEMVTVATSVTGGSAPVTGLNVDLVVWNAAGVRVGQQVFVGQSFAAGQTRSYSWRWTVRAGLPPGTYRISVGVFDATWRTMYAVVDRAATVSVR